MTTAVRLGNLLGRERPGLPVVPKPAQVNLSRFMGAWYVIGGILTPLERFACNAVEHYELESDGSITTRFRFRLGSADGRFVELRSRAFVSADPSNALWRMQFLPPLKLDYRIAWLDDDYTMTVIAREARDLLWIMARTPQIDDSDLGRLIRFADDIGYDTDAIFTVPQRWPQ